MTAEKLYHLFQAHTRSNNQLPVISTEVLSRWAEDCNRSSKELDRLGSSTENVFLTLGGNLQEFYTRAQEMCVTSQEVVGLMAGEEIQSASSDLGTFLKDLDTYLGETTGQYAQMRTLLQQHTQEIGRIVSDLESFQMQALNLNILGFLTRVEVAHVDSEETGFSGLIEDVKKLSETITIKIHQIRSASYTVHSRITRALTDVSRQNRTHDTTARISYMQAVDNEKSLVRKYENAVVAAHIIKAGTNRVVEGINNIVMSLQFHDITRQQIQHVQTVLDQLGSHLQKTEVSGQDQAAIVRESLTLQHDQLEETRNEFVQAVTKVVINLGTIADNMGEILSQICHVACATDRDSLSTMQEIEDGIGAIIKHIKNSAEDEVRLNATLHAVGAEVAQMGVFVKDIETIGMNLEILALNARIRAARLGRKGATLDTISGCIYDLSRETRARTSALSQTLEHLGRISHEFTQTVLVRQERQAETVRQLMDKLTATIVLLSNINTWVQAKAQNLSSLGKSLMQDLRASAASINVHERVAATLSQASTLIKLTARQAGSLNAQDGQTVAAAFLSGIDQTYTMHSERTVHARHLETDTVPLPEDSLQASVELF